MTNELLLEKRPLFNVKKKLKIKILTKDEETLAFKKLDELLKELKVLKKKP
jgi:hypothetical protein